MTTHTRLWHDDECICSVLLCQKKKKRGGDSDLPWPTLWSTTTTTTTTGIYLHTLFDNHKYLGYYLCISIFNAAPKYPILPTVPNPGNNPTTNSSYIICCPSSSSSISIFNTAHQYPIWPVVSHSCIIPSPSHQLIVVWLLYYILIVIHHLPHAYLPSMQRRPSRPRPRTISLWFIE